MLNEKLKQAYNDHGIDKFIYTSQGIPIPFDPAWKRIGFNISGGADSAILAYTVLKHIDEHNLDIEAHTISHIRCWTTRPWQRTIRLRVIQKLKDYFPNIKIVEHENYIPVEIEMGVAGSVIPVDGQMKSGDQIENSSYARYIGFRFELDAAYCATTRNPPHLNKNGGDPGRDLALDSIDFDQMVYGPYHTGIFPMQVKPFMYYTKDQVICEYFVNNVEELLNTTRSCEGETGWMRDAAVAQGINNKLVEHSFEKAYVHYNPDLELPDCGQCFWCLEKQWAIAEAGRLLHET